MLKLQLFQKAIKPKLLPFRGNKISVHSGENTNIGATRTRGL